ncbi:MAG: hypothetical protein ACJAS4_001459 [Bacteriovoracaceae bacterium]|jgi:hypothetical protein
MKKIITSLIILLFSFNSLAELDLKFDFKSTEAGKIISLNQNIKANFDEVKTIKIPDSDQIIEMMITENIPESMRNDDIVVGEVFLDIKVYQNFKSGKKLISSPKIITTFGNEASLEMISDKNDKNPKTSIKVIPTVL